MLYRLAELLVDISEGFWLLTAAHVRIAERTIGQKPGTAGPRGGVPGAGAGVEGVPGLWDVRTRLLSRESGAKLFDP